MDEVRSGYPGLATIMGPYSGMALFKRFSELNARNLLYLQAELIDLEQQLKVLTILDHRSQDPNVQSYERSLLELSRSAANGDDRQWQKVLEIRAKLKEYNEALLQQAKINKLESANTYDLRILQDWLRRPEGGANFLQGYEARPWKDAGLKDLVALSGTTRQSHDPFTRWTGEKLVPWFHKKLFHHAKTPLPNHEAVGLVEWEDGRFATTARVLSVIISTLFPAVAILTLYFIRSLVARLGAVIAFSALFSTVLAVFTAARPVEIFAATAACASVQVVFVGSTSISNGTAY